MAVGAIRGWVLCREDIEANCGDSEEEREVFRISNGGFKRKFIGSGSRGQVF